MCDSAKGFSSRLFSRALSIFEINLSAFTESVTGIVVLSIFFRHRHYNCGCSFQIQRAAWCSTAAMVIKCKSDVLNKIQLLFSENKKVYTILLFGLR